MFCDGFLEEYPMKCIREQFFTVDGLVYGHWYPIFAVMIGTGLRKGHSGHPWPYGYFHYIGDLCRCDQGV